MPLLCLRYLSWYNNLTVVNSFAVTMAVQVSVGNTAFQIASVLKEPYKRIAQKFQFFSFSGESIFISTVIVLIYARTVSGTLPTSASMWPTFAAVCFLDGSHSDQSEMGSLCILISCFLIFKNIYLAIFIFSFEKFLFSSFALIFIRSLNILNAYFMLFIILDINSLCEHIPAQFLQHHLWKGYPLSNVCFQYLCSKSDSCNCKNLFLHHMFYFSGPYIYFVLALCSFCFRCYCGSVVYFR